MMVKDHRKHEANYRAQLIDVMRRAEAVELRARQESVMLGEDDPQRAAWMRIERRYATIRGNAQHLLLIHDWTRQRHKPLFRVLRYLNLL